MAGCYTLAGMGLVETVRNERYEMRAEGAEKRDRRMGEQIRRTVYIRRNSKYVNNSVSKIGITYL